MAHGATCMRTEMQWNDAAQKSCLVIVAPLWVGAEAGEADTRRAFQHCVCSVTEEVSQSHMSRRAWIERHRRKCWYWRVKTHKGQCEREIIDSFKSDKIPQQD